MSVVVNFGRWGGFYFYHGDSVRVCLGWVAITVLKYDIDFALVKMTQEINALKLKIKELTEV